MISEQQRPLVLGHRGASAHAGDNTIEAFELALAHGADGVEIDARFTADQVVVLHHDPDVGEMGPLIHHDFAAVRSTHPEIPTLDEALAVLGDLIVNVEIKNSPMEPDHDPGHGVADAVARWVNRHDIHERVVVTSFNPDTVAAIRNADPVIVTGQLVNPGVELPEVIEWVSAAGHGWIAPYVADVVPNAIEVTAAAHGIGLRVAVWTVDDPADIHTLGGAGVDAIIANDPRAALEVLRGD
ncbi:MAG: glycerophosphodiester phosphodiesterase [Acidimicrobiia bacterium]|nr:glycerophosphodiester phosphodiesterase [Acidimicrobiia bacterium]